jgi:hypothetical protein
MAIEVDASTRIAVTWISRSIGATSLVGSVYVIFRLFSSSSSSSPPRLHLTFDRLLLALCICDLFSSFAYVLGDWPVPQTARNSIIMDEVLGQDNTLYEQLFRDAKGNQATCNVQGFLFQVGTLGSVLFVGFIAIQYVLVVVCKKTPKSLRHWEIGFFGLGFLLPIGSAIVLILADYMNPNYAAVCWVYISPIMCGEAVVNSQTAELQEQIITWCADNPDIIRGMNYHLVAFLVGYLWVFLVLILLVVCMLLLWWKVRTTHQRSEEWVNRWQDRSSSGQSLAMDSTVMESGVYHTARADSAGTLEGIASDTRGPETMEDSTENQSERMERLSPPTKGFSLARPSLTSVFRRSLSRMSLADDQQKEGSQRRSRRNQQQQVNNYVINKARKIIAIYVILYLPAVVMAQFPFFSYTTESIIVAILLPMQGLLNALAYSEGFEKMVHKLFRGFCWSSQCWRDNTPAPPSSAPANPANDNSSNAVHD